MQVEVELKGPAEEEASIVRVCCGKGKQTIKWLALSASLRHESNVFRRNRPLGVWFKGILIDPNKRVKDVLRCEDENELKEVFLEAPPCEGTMRCSVSLLASRPDRFLVLLARSQEENTCFWQDVAFSQSPEAAARLSHFEDCKRRQEMQKLEEQRMKLEEESRAAFMKEIGETSFAADQHEEQHAKDWLEVRPYLQELFMQDGQELKQMKQHFFQFARILHETYCWLRQDHEGVMSMNIVKILQECQACEERDQNRILLFLSESEECDLDRIQFYETVIRILCTDGAIRWNQHASSPSKRFFVIMSTIVGPFLEDKFQTSAAIVALCKKEVLDVFVNAFSALRGAFTKYSNIFTRRSSSKRLLLQNSLQHGLFRKKDAVSFAQNSFKISKKRMGAAEFLLFVEDAKIADLTTSEGSKLEKWTRTGQPVHSISEAQAKMLFGIYQNSRDDEDDTLNDARDPETITFKEMLEILVRISLIAIPSQIDEAEKVSAIVEVLVSL